MRSLEQGPVLIHSRGRDVGAIVDIDAYERLTAHAASAGRTGGLRFVETVEGLKQRHGGGVQDFVVEPAVIVPGDPFRGPRRP